MTDSMHIQSFKGLCSVRDALKEMTHRIDAHADLAQEKLTAATRELRKRGEWLHSEMEDARRAVDELDEDDCGDDEYERLDAANDALRKYEALVADWRAAQRQYSSELALMQNQCKQLLLRSANEAEKRIGLASAFKNIQEEGEGAAAPEQANGTISASAVRASNPVVATPFEALRQRCSSQGLPAGFYWLDLNNLPEECFVVDPSQFKHVDKDRIRQSVRLLHERVIPELQSNPALGEDHFAKIDEAENTGFDEFGFVKAESLQTVWKAFLDRRHSAEVIRVANVTEDGRIDLMDGRHRLGVARELGYRFMPVRFGTGDGPQ